MRFFEKSIKFNVCDSQEKNYVLVVSQSVEALPSLLLTGILEERGIDHYVFISTLNWRCEHGKSLLPVFLSDSLYYLINSYYCLVQLIRYPVWLIHHELTRFWYTEINLFFLRYYSWKSKSTGGKKQQTKIYLVLLVPWWAFSFVY